MAWRFEWVTRRLPDREKRSQRRRGNTLSESVLPEIKELVMGQRCQWQLLEEEGGVTERPSALC